MSKFFVNKVSLLLHLLTLATAIIVAFLSYQQESQNKALERYNQQLQLAQEINLHVTKAFQFAIDKLTNQTPNFDKTSIKHLKKAQLKVQKLDNIKVPEISNKKTFENIKAEILNLLSQLQDQHRSYTTDQLENKANPAEFISLLLRFEQAEARLTMYLESESLKIQQSTSTNNISIFALVGLLVLLVSLELYKHYHPQGTLKDFFKAGHLNQNEALFKSFFKYNSATMLLIDPNNGDILDCNYAASEFYGYNKNTLTSMQINHLNTRSRGQIQGNMRAAINKKNNHFFFTHQLADSTKKEVEIYSSPLKINNKNVLFSIVHDITERRTAEEALQKSEKYYRGLFENAHDAVIILSPENEIILDANQRACDVYGYEKSSFIGKSMTKLSKHASNGSLHIKKTLKNKHYHNFESIHLNKKGDELFMDINASVIDHNDSQAILSINRDITDRKRAEEALRKSEEKHRQIFINAPIGIFRTSFTGKFLDINPATARMFGYESTKQMIDQIQNITTEIYYNPRDRLKLLQNIRSTEKVQHLETVFKKRNGDYFDVLLTIYPVKNNTGTITHLEGVIQDITARKEAEAYIQNININLEKEVQSRTQQLNSINNNLIKEIEERKSLEKQIFREKELWRRSFVSISEGIFLIDTNYNILQCNKAFADIVGEKPEELIGKKAHEVIHGYSTPPNYCISCNAINKKKNIKGEFWEPYLQKYIQTTSDPVFDHDHIEFSINTLRDITEEKRYEKALKKSEEKFRTYIENAPIGIFLANGQGRYLGANPEGLQLLNYSMEELLNYSIPDIAPKSEQKNVRDTFQSLREHENYYHETKLLTSRGETVNVFVNAVKLEEDRYLAFVLDISDRKKAEENIYKSLEREKELNEMKTRFISMVSHEFRTPLANIYSNAQLLDRFEEKWNKEKKEQSLERIMNSVQVLNSMLDDVSLFGKKQSGKLEFNPTPVNIDQFLSTIIDETLSGFNPNRTVNIKNTESIGTIHTDKFLIRHVITNLVSNALKYSGDTREVVVRQELQGSDQMNISVEDQGKGIPENEINNIFEPFYRASNIENVSGTGLGMAIVKHCADLLGGKLTVESEINKGTTVNFSFPFQLNSKKPNKPKIPWKTKS